MKYIASVLLLLAATSAQNAPSTSKSPDLDIPAIAREANGSVVSIVMSDKDGHPLIRVQIDRLTTFPTLKTLGITRL
jgi:hypothetical protein